MSSRRRLLRIPAALAVAVVGTSAWITMAFSGCSASSGPEPLDATKASSVKVDAAIDSGTRADGDNVDAPVDSAVVIELPDGAARVVDAYKPPPDAGPV
jgi:hypothetical protein